MKNFLKELVGLDYYLAHHGVKGMKWGVRKDHEPMTKFNLKTSKVMLGKTPGVKYEWTDKNSKPVAKFTTFDWWDGKNIEDLKVYDQYKGNGYSYQLLDYATKKLGVRNLSVRKDNAIAKHVYDNYGFKTTYQDNDLYYMSLNK